jgi:hypothetical protein
MRWIVALAGFALGAWWGTAYPVLAHHRNNPVMDTTCTRLTDRQIEELRATDERHSDQTRALQAQIEALRRERDGPGANTTLKRLEEFDARILRLMTKLADIDNRQRRIKTKIDVRAAPGLCNKRSGR